MKDKLWSLVAKLCSKEPAPVAAPAQSLAEWLEKGPEPAPSAEPLNVDRTDDLARKFGTYKGNQEWVFTNANLFGFARALLEAHKEGA